MQNETFEIDDIEIITEFVNEAFAHLNALEAAILSLEKSPDDIELINEIFRTFHSIKGGAGFIGLKRIGNISHEVENLLDEARKKKLTITSETIDILFEGTDILERLLFGVMAQAGVKSSSHTGDKKKDDVSDEDMSCLTGKVEKLLSLKGKNVPVKDKEEKEKEHKKIGEILVEQGIVKPKDVKNALDIQKKYSGRTAHEDIRVDMEKINTVMNAVGELVISYSLVDQLIASQGARNGAENNRLDKEMSNHGKLVRQIQGQVTSMRMVQIKSTFQKMARLVRDLSKKEGKEVELKTGGEDTEVDKIVIEELGDPLVHIIRNAVDHGIEPPEQRKNKGKPAKGSISLNAYHKGGNIVIEITDDGRGLNKDAIVKKGIERGLIDQDQELSDRDIYDLIFAPGFSTAQKVTNVSGRGVGMDVVKRNIEKLRGKVDIRSEEGKGSTFTIRLPLTMAIIDGMMVSVGAERYIIPTFSIVESIRPKKTELTTVENKMEVVNARGNLLPMIRLHSLYGITPNTTNPWEAMVIVVEGNGNRVCILVDNLLGQQQVVIKSLDSRFGKVKSISGGAILGDGRVSLILDVESLIESFNKKEVICYGDSSGNSG